MFPCVLSFLSSPFYVQQIIVVLFIVALFLSILSIFSFSNPFHVNSALTLLSHNLSPQGDVCRHTSPTSSSVNIFPTAPLSAHFVKTKTHCVSVEPLNNTTLSCSLRIYRLILGLVWKNRRTNTAVHTSFSAPFPEKGQTAPISGCEKFSPSDG